MIYVVWEIIGKRFWKENEKLHVKVIDNVFEK